MENRKYDGFAEVIKHAFTGFMPHILEISLNNGTVRRFAFHHMKDAKSKCAEFNVKLKG